MIRKIAHLADVHIRKSPTRHEEVREVFNNLYVSLIEQKPDRITLVGDLFHDYIDLQPEATILATEFLNKLATIAPVRITRGNHDIRKKALKRKDAIEAIVTAIDNPNIEYYNETKFYDDENVSWAVWKHGEKNNSPWRKRSQKPKEGNTTIDLFHDPVQGAVSPTGYEFNSVVYKEHKHFKGDYSFFGDIHKVQHIQGAKAYSGSLIAQDFSEGDDNEHGYLLWNIEEGTCEFMPIENNYSFNTVIVNVFTDFDDLELELENPTLYNKVRVIWRTLPEIRNNDNERKVLEYLKEKYSILSISQKNEFTEEDSLDVDDELEIEAITNQSIQHDIFRSYLEKVGVEEDEINEIIELDDEITSRIEIEDFTNIQWSVVKLNATNFMSYETLDVNWSDNDGLYQITGLNTAGKTTIMKLISYILYGKTLETETRMKYGDLRYVNNRNGATYCEGSIVIEVNGEYFGIKRRTDIEKNKNGEVKGAPTILNYHRLESATEEFTDDNEINNLVDEDRQKTQKVIERAIGSYDNFMRVVMTTSDTLNNTLSNDRSVFIDSLLHDSGLDIFDAKLNAFKDFHKEYLSKPRVNCDVEKTKEKIKYLEGEVEKIVSESAKIENETLPDVSDRVEKGNDYVESLVKKMYRIDDTIYNLDVEKTKSNISVHEHEINDLRQLENKYKKIIDSLDTEYDEDKYNELIAIKDGHKEREVNLKSQIKEFELHVYNAERSIEQINGKIVLLKKEGASYKEEIFKLKNSDTCPTCGQELGEEHKKHTQEKIKEIESNMYDVAKQIKDEEQNITDTQHDIEHYNGEKQKAEKVLGEEAVRMEDVLNEIGVFTNIINNVKKRDETVIELDKIPPQIEILDLRIANLQKNIDLYDQSVDQINVNKKIESGIAKAKERLNVLNSQKNNLNDDLYNLKTQYGTAIANIRDYNDLIISFEEQEKLDNRYKIYKKCIHRDGIPTQLLINYAIPKINNELSSLLSDVAFSVWLDENDLKLKLAYSKIESTIDAISASGKERTFASVALKFALNQINAKSKPTLFLLDEVMGKLTDDSVDEFVNLVTAIKDRTKKVLVVEHNHEIEPDFVIKVEKDENEISSLVIE